MRVAIVGLGLRVSEPIMLMLLLELYSSLTVISVHEQTKKTFINQLKNLKVTSSNV